MWGSTWAAQTAWWRQQNGGAPRGATATRPFGNATVLALGTVRPTTDNTMGGLTSACVETTHTAPHSTDYGSTTVPDDSGNGAGAGEGQGQGGRTRAGSADSAQWCVGCRAQDAIRMQKVVSVGRTSHRLIEEMHREHTAADAAVMESLRSLRADVRALQTSVAELSSRLAIHQQTPSIDRPSVVRPATTNVAVRPILMPPRCAPSLAASFPSPLHHRWHSDQWDLMKDLRPGVAHQRQEPNHKRTGRRRKTGKSLSKAGLPRPPRCPGLASSC